MDVLRQYQYLLFELTQETKRNKPERPFSYKVWKNPQRAKKKQKDSLEQILFGDSEVLYGRWPQLNVYSLFPCFSFIYQESMLAVLASDDISNHLAYALLLED